MSTEVTLPSFYFTVDHLESLYPRWVNSMWQPSRKKEHHTIVGNSHRSTRAYYFDGQTQRAGTELVKVAGPAEPTQCYCLYKDTANKLWIIDHDATKEMMGNGQDQDTLTDEDEDVNDDWSCLTFRKSRMASLLPVKCSYVAHGEEDEHLQFSNGTVAGWMQHLLPRKAYEGRSTTRISTPHGLVGDLALLLGLIAISIPTTHMKRLLPTLLGRRWAWPTTDFYSPMYRAAGITGVRIQLWLAHAPPTSSRTNDQAFASLNNATRLAFYQEGGCGPIISGAP